MKKCFLTELFKDEYANLIAFNYVDQGRKVTYSALIEKIRVVQRFLRKQGVSKGDRVLVSFDAEEELLTAFVAIMSLGAVMLPVSTALTGHELKNISRVLPFRYTLTRFSFLADHQDALLNVQGLEAVFTPDEGTSEIQADLLVLHTKVEATQKREYIRIPADSQIITSHFTMKGFGLPLGVEHTYDTYCRTITSCHEIFKFKPGQRILSILPSYPVFGLVTNLLYPLSAGTELIIQDKKMNNILKAIKTHNIQHMNVVPVILEKMLLEASKLEVPMDLSHMVIVAGGSWVSPELHSNFLKTFNMAPVQGYGLTETLPILTNRPETAKSGTLGQIMRSDVEMKIMDARGFEVPKGKAGEICFRGKGVISKYIGNEDHHESVFRGSWLRTGDIGYINEDDHVVFVGRRLNFTKVSGNMVDLKEIEDLVKGIHGVKTARSYVITEKGREKLSLSLFVTRDFSLGRKDIIEHCRKFLSTYKVPAQIKIYKSSYDEVIG